MNITDILPGHKVQPNPGDYYANDGLLKCGKCGGWREYRLDVKSESMNIDRIVPCMCTCEARAYSEGKRDQWQRERLAAIDRMKSSSIQDKGLLRYRFEMDDNSGFAPSNFAKQYVVEWHKMHELGHGIVFWGEVGTGKSFYLGCIANALMDKGVSVCITNIPRIIGQLQGQFDKDVTKYLAEFDRYDCLIIDDLGVERQTEFVQEQIYQIIDNRYKLRKPLLTSTNKTIEELENPQGTMQARIYDRLLSICVPIRLAGSSRRIKEGTAAMEEFKRIINEPSKQNQEKE